MRNEVLRIPIDCSKMANSCNFKLFSEGCVISSQTTQIALNVYSKLRNENPETSVSFIVNRTAELTGLSKRTIYQIRSTVKLTSPYSKLESTEEKHTRCERYPGKKIKVEKINIHYEEIGSGNHKLLLLPGALGSTRTDFGPQFEKLDKSKFTLISWDPPGYGYSRPPRRTFPKDFYHQDAHLVVALMKKLGHHKYSILGWSDGGTVGMIIAACYPDIVQKLVVWGSTAYFTDDDLNKMNAAKDIQTWNRRMLEPMLELYGKEYFLTVWLDYLDAVQNIVSNGGDICKEDLKKIQCETLILHGDKDPLVPFFHIPYLLNHIKNSKCYRIPEGRHNIHLRYAEEFNEQISKFLLN